MRPVDADAIPYKRDIVVTERFPKFGGFNGKIVYSVTKEEIDAMPTIDAAPVRHGRWEMMSCHDMNQREMRYRCSRCHHDTITHGSAPWERYCPMCGAKLDGKDGDHEKAD